MFDGYLILPASPCNGSCSGEQRRGVLIARGDAEGLEQRTLGPRRICRLAQLEQRLASVTRIVRWSMVRHCSALVRVSDSGGAARGARVEGADGNGPPIGTSRTTTLEAKAHRALLVERSPPARRRQTSAVRADMLKSASKPPSLQGLSSS